MWVQFSSLFRQLTTSLLDDWFLQSPTKNFTYTEVPTTSYTITYYDSTTMAVCDSATIEVSRSMICDTFRHTFEVALSPCNSSTELLITAFVTNAFGDGATSRPAYVNLTQHVQCSCNCKWQLYLYYIIIMCSAWLYYVCVIGNHVYGLVLYNDSVTYPWTGTNGTGFDLQLAISIIASMTPIISIVLIVVVVVLVKRKSGCACTCKTCHGNRHTGTEMRTMAATAIYEDIVLTRNTDASEQGSSTIHTTENAAYGHLSKRRN